MRLAPVLFAIAADVATIGCSGGWQPAPVSQNAQNAPVEEPEPAPMRAPKPKKAIAFEMLGVEAQTATVAIPVTTATTLQKLDDELRAAAALMDPKQTAHQKHQLIDLLIMNNCTPTPQCMAAIGRGLGAKRLLYGAVSVSGSLMTLKLTLLDVATETESKWSIVDTPTTDENIAAVSRRGVASLIKRAP